MKPTCRQKHEFHDDIFQLKMGRRLNFRLVENRPCLDVVELVTIRSEKKNKIRKTF